MGATEGLAPQSVHRSVEKQCVACRAATAEVPSPTDQKASSTAHAFRVAMKACEPCHTAANAGVSRTATQANAPQRASAVKVLLDAWGKTMAAE